MSKFIKVLQEVVEKQTDNIDKQDTHSLIINRIEFQKMQVETKLLLQSFTQLTLVRIINCDLRTLDNFPIIRSLKEVCVANNRLQGSVENLVKLDKLEYLDISFNLIKYPGRLSPLKRIQSLSVYVNGNPFCKMDGWKTVLDTFKLNVEKQPRDPSNEPKQQAQPPPPEPVQQKSPVNKYVLIDYPNPEPQPNPRLPNLARRGGSIRLGGAQIPPSIRHNLERRRNERRTIERQAMSFNRFMNSDPFDFNVGRMDRFEDVELNHLLQSEESDRVDELGMDEPEDFEDDEEEECNNTFLVDDDSDSSNQEQS